LVFVFVLLVVFVDTEVSPPIPDPARLGPAAKDAAGSATAKATAALRMILVRFFMGFYDGYIIALIYFRVKGLQNTRRSARSENGSAFLPLVLPHVEL
jgi:hypothetical protein